MVQVKKRRIWGRPLCRRVLVRGLDTGFLTRTRSATMTR
jgi:hypothetical protein